MINFAANLHKHGLLRLGRIMERLRKLCAQSGVQVNGLDIIAVRDPFVMELESRLLYLSSWLVELLGAYFLGINSVDRSRYNVDGTNDVGRMRIPYGVTSESIRNLYGSTLVFGNYAPGRILRYTPTVPGSHEGAVLTGCSTTDGPAPLLADADGVEPTTAGAVTARREEG